MDGWFDNKEMKLQSSGAILCNQRRSSYRLSSFFDDQFAWFQSVPLIAGVDCPAVVWSTFVNLFSIENRLDFQMEAYYCIKITVDVCCLKCTLTLSTCKNLVLSSYQILISARNPLASLTFFLCLSGCTMLECPISLTE